MNTAHSTWTSEAEAALRGLRDVEGAVIQADGDEIREVHILTSSRRPAKQIVRDVQTLLLARFRRSIDHRVVSVAFAERSETRRPSPAAVGERAAPAPAPAPAPGEPREERIRFGSANLFVAGPRVQAQVELNWRGLTRTGSASGHATREGSHRLVAEAALDALQEFLEEGMAFSLDGLEFATLGRREVAIVSVQLVARRENKCLVGCCAVEQDVPEAVALATLAAINRVLGGLPTREPTEYVLRPASM